MMSKTDELNNLFVEWKKAHENESNDEYKNYRVDNIDKNSFCNDGIICEEKFNGLMFICKESHIKDDNTGFWLKKVSDNDDVKPYLFGTRLILTANAFFSGNYTDIDSNRDCNVLKQVALLNLNKRGGKNNTNNKSLEQYTYKYVDYIEKEISIINPATIILCGTGDLFNKYIKSKFDYNSVKLIYLKHPSYRCISHLNYLKELKKQIENDIRKTENVK